MEYVRRVVSILVLLVGAAVIWYLGHGLLDLTGAMIDTIGPIWSLIILGVVTAGLAAVWIRYGGVGALGRWGVTIKPAIEPGPLADADDDASERADADLPPPAGRRGPGRTR